jgi:photosystem II stability/assembly factor-like uncharacterized protein
MERAYAAMRSGLLVVDGDAATEMRLTEYDLECAAVHPEKPQRAFVGTYDSGLFRSTDSGDSWSACGAETIAQDAVMSVAINPDDPDEVWAGTEPSRIYHSGDGGQTWTHRDGLVDLSSEPEWSFPPRPQTHHVRWIEVDPHDPAHLYVGIEAGALVQTHDRGATWVDRVAGSKRDNHTLATHPDAPGRVYSAAGDGYAESHDGGDTWHSYETDLGHGYVWGLAVDPGEPDLVLVSSATGARSAHTAATADAHLYRRTGDGPWEHLSETGLPTGDGALRSVLTRGTASGEFYALNNQGLFRTTTAGDAWDRFETPWPERFTTETARGLAVVSGE